MFHEVNLSAMAACVGERWSLKIGDPTVVGWLTVALYAVCAVLGFMTRTRSQHSRERFFWGLLALAMIFLGVNKQLDLQSMLTAAGHCLSQLQGWYEERQGFQRNFIIGLLTVASLFLALVPWLMRGCLRRNGLAILGLAFITAFVAVRAAGFQHFDALIDSGLLDTRKSVLFELSGLILIAANAMALLGAKPSGVRSG